MNGTGREWPDWSNELRIAGDQLTWKFTSDGSVNGWGWKFTVYPVMPADGPLDLMSDRGLLSTPSMDFASCLLDPPAITRLSVDIKDHRLACRLAAALAACAQLGSLGELFGTICYFSIFRFTLRGTELPCGLAL